MKINIQCNKQAPTIVPILGTKITIPRKGTICLDARDWLELKRIKSKWVDNGAIFPVNSTEEEKTISEYRIEFIQILEREGRSRVQSKFDSQYDFSFYEVNLVKKWLADKNDIALIEVSEQAKESLELSRISQSEARNSNRIALGALLVGIISLLISIFSPPSP